MTHLPVCERQPLWEGSERIRDAYSLPSQRFSLALSFPQPSPLLWGTSRLTSFHDFMRQTGSFPFCAASWECAAWHVTWRGMGKKESGGLGEKTRKGKGDCSRAAPPSPGLSPQASGKTLLRKRSTQSINDKPQAGGRQKAKQQGVRPARRA